MTATQVLMLFLKQECTIGELRFFKNIIFNCNGNKYFRKRPLYTPTFVEDYLSRNHRALNNFMTRLFILAPNLVRKSWSNPREKIIARVFNEKHMNHMIPIKVKDWYGNETGEIQLHHVMYRPFSKGMYVNYYKRKWNVFLKEHIESDKKFNSPFKKGEIYNFDYK